MSSAAAAGGDAPPPAAGGGSGQKKKGAKRIEKGQFRAKGGVSATTAGAGGGARKRSTVAIQPQPPGSRQRQDDLRLEDAHTQPRRPLSKNNSVSGLAGSSENSDGIVVVVVAMSWPSTITKRGKQVLASHAGSRRTEAGGGAEEENQGEKQSGEPSSSSASSSSYSSTDLERPSGKVDSFCVRRPLIVNVPTGLWEGRGMERPGIQRTLFAFVTLVVFRRDRVGRYGLVGSTMGGPWSPCGFDVQGDSFDRRVAGGGQVPGLGCWTAFLSGRGSGSRISLYSFRSGL
ncbi:hypothetical protein A4X13_0g6817 [Tilletia indica]|uniref:Uncharacterized protein n=1 Tax=Tilletia indica TaxID=43049 RepID=A0A177T738_9BASI|nr:hypothetical protein A4X13_0g6817 [Tilletia indica]